MERLDRHLHFAVVGAVGFGVVTGLSFLIGPCHGCDRLAELFAVVRTGVAGGIGGAVVSASYDRLRWAGAVGEYALGATATWLALIVVVALRPSMQTSFFESFGRGAPASVLLLPALVIGTVGTFEIRRRTRRARAAADDGDGSGDSPADPFAGRWLTLRHGTSDAFLVGLAIMLALWVDGRIREASWSPDAYWAAVEANRENVATYPDEPIAHLYLAMALLDVQEWDAARASAERAIELDPDGAEQHAALGWAHIGLGRPKDARAPFETAATLSPENVTIWRDLARLAYMVGDSTRALEAYEEVRRLSPDPALWGRQDREAWQRLSGAR